MKILFIDESKKVELKMRKLFLLLGIVVDSENLFRVEYRLKKLKEAYNLNNLKDLKNNKLNLDKKKEICKKITKILEEERCFVLSIILGQIAMRDVKSFEKCYLSAIGFLIDRFFLNLNLSKDYGLVIHDSVEGSEKMFREGFREYVTTQSFLLPGWKKGYKLSERIYPCLSFFDDQHCEILQCSDLIALALNSSLWKNDGNLSEQNINVEGLKKSNEFLEIYWNLFPKDKNGFVNGYGIKIWY